MLLSVWRGRDEGSMGLGIDAGWSSEEEGTTLDEIDSVEEDIRFCWEGSGLEGGVIG